ncbi:MAG: DMT family transporter [Fidelibacterota bacterium]
MTANRKAIMQLHTAVLLFGFAGLFGKLITAAPVVIVLGRTTVAAVTLSIIIKAQGYSLKPARVRDWGGFGGMGVLLVLHWVTFFQSIRVSTVAIGLLTYASFPVFVTLLEPLLFRTRLAVMDLIYLFFVVIGLLVIVPELSLANRITAGVFWGVLSGLSFAVLTLLNKSYSRRYSPLSIAFWQDGIAALLLLPAVLIVPCSLSVTDIGYILLLGIFCTALAHTLFIYSMQQVRAFTAGIAASLEPVYGIVLALIILREVPALRTVIGGLVILIVVASVSYRAD